MTQFVWSHINAEAAGDELRYAIRSVYTYFDGEVKVLLVGDKPDWYSGEFIELPRIPKPSTPGSPHGLMDTLAKMNSISTHPAVDEQFVSMMDDHYFLKKVTMSQLEISRITQGWSPKPKGCWWDRAIVRTMQTLELRGLPTHLYDTHLMHVFEKSKLQQLFQDFNLLQEPLLRNTLYGNVFRTSPKSCRPFIATPQSKQTTQQLDQISKSATVLNHGSSAWYSGMRQWLQRRLPDAAPVESTQQPAATSGEHSSSISADAPN